MKRKLALLLALVMVISMLPMTAFAASTNNVTRVLTVGANQDLSVLTNTPELRIVNKDNTFGAVETFRLQLSDDAEWNGTGASIASAMQAASTGVTFTVTKRTDQIIEVTANGANATNAVIVAPLNVTLDDASGEQKVTIIPVDSALTGGTYTFAVAAAGATVATVGTKETLNRGRNQAGTVILLDETRIGSVGSTSGSQQQFRLRLPRGFKWEAGTTVTSTGFGAGTTNFTVAVDGRDATVTGVVYKSTGVRGSLTITPLIEVTKDANHGDVTVDITSQRGDISSVSGLVVGSYKDYGISVEIDEVEEFYAGRVDADYITDKIVIKENIAGSFFVGRTIDFELPEWVRVADDFNIRVTNGGTTTSTPVSADLAGDADVNTFSYTVLSGDTKLELEIPLTISGTKTGDIELIVKGAGIETTEIVIAEAVAPVTVEVKETVAPFAIGVQNQLGAEIFITEAEAGALIEKEDIELKVQAAFKGSMRFESFKYEVVEGDIEIGSTGRIDENSGLKLEVKAESSKASTIRVYDIKMTLDRTIPEGPFSLNVGGKALVNNGAYDDMPSRIVRFEYMEVGTVVGVKEEVKFTIGSTNYMVGTELEPMGVAPYIKDNRTFVPVTFIARALGMDRSAVVWNGTNRTVTIFGERVVQMEIGSTVMMINGISVTMDTAPEITMDRTFVPIAHAARALGVDYSWDQATQTVTFH